MLGQISDWLVEQPAILLVSFIPLMFVGVGLIIEGIDPFRVKNLCKTAVGIVTLVFGVYGICLGGYIDHYSRLKVQPYHDPMIKLIMHARGKC